GAAGEPKPVHFADHGVSGHISELGGDLAGRKSGLPELLELLDTVIGPGQYRHPTLPFARCRPDRGQRCAAKSSKKSLRAESLRARRAQKARLDVYASHQKLRGSELPHEMSYPTKKTLQYAVTPAQESGLAFHMFRHLGIAIGISTASAVLRSRQRLPNAA